jgi:hypothetical protein
MMLILGALSVIGGGTEGVGNAGPSSVAGRAGRVRRGSYETAPGVWQEAGQPSVPVTVVLDGSNRFIESDTFSVPVSAVTPLGILDYPARPRATTPDGTELDSGLVLRTADQVTTLLLGKADLAVIAVLAGWPSPGDLPHGQNARAIIGRPPHGA